MSHVKFLKGNPFYEENEEEIRKSYNEKKDFVKKVQRENRGY